MYSAPIQADLGGYLFNSGSIHSASKRGSLALKKGGFDATQVTISKFQMGQSTCSHVCVFPQETAHTSLRGGVQ